MNIGVVDSELNFNYRLFCKTVSNSATWGFDRLRLYYPKWHTRIQVRRPDGSVLDTQQFATDNGFEHDFSFDLSENVSNEEYSVYICGVAEGNTYMQAYAYPTGYSATYGRNAQVTYWNLNIISPEYTAGVHGSLFLENQPLTTIDGALNIKAKTVRLQNSQLDAETLADIIIGLDGTGITGGSLNYSGNLAAPAERALTAYNSLKDTKGWTLTGDVPSDDPVYDANYQAVLDYATANSIPLPTTAESDANNQLIIDLKANGAWAKMDFFFQFKGAVSSSFKLICWKRATQAVGYGSLTWSSDGVNGNGSNAYIDTLIDLSTLTNYQLNNAGIYYVTLDNPNGTITPFGVMDALNGTNSIPNRNPQSNYFRLNASVDSGEFPNKTRQAVGLNGISREDAAAITLSYGASSVNFTQDSLGIPAGYTLPIFALNREDVLSQFNTARFTYFFGGASMLSNYSALRNLLE